MELEVDDRDLPDFGEPLEYSDGDTESLAVAMLNVTLVDFPSPSPDAR